MFDQLDDIHNNHYADKRDDSFHVFCDNHIYNNVEHVNGIKYLDAVFDLPHNQYVSEFEHEHGDRDDRIGHIQHFNEQPIKLKHELDLNHDHAIDNQHGKLNDN